LQAAGINLTQAPIQITDNARAPFPYEPHLQAMRRKCDCIGATLVTTSVEKEQGLTGQVRVTKLILSHRLDSGHELWCRELLMSNQLDHSFAIMEAFVQLMTGLGLMSIWMFFSHQGSVPANLHHPEIQHGFPLPFPAAGFSSIRRHVRALRSAHVFLFRAGLDRPLRVVHGHSGF
jgi:hypothetical protein